MVLEYTASVSVTGLLIWLIKLIFYDKIDARWHYFIWLVLLVRILVPASVRPIPTQLSVFQEIPIGRWIEMGRITAEKKGYGVFLDLLGWVFLWGAVLLAIFYLATWLLLRIRTARAPKADASVREYVDGIGAKYGLKSCRDIRILRSRSPYICGLVHPVLVLPEGGERPEECIIVHELLHKRYRDVLVNIGVHAVRVMNWFNPLIWLLTAAVLNDSEALCDQRVLEYCGEGNEKSYGELLIAMGEGKERNSARIGTSNMAGSYRNMKTRIRRIRDFRRVPAKIGLVTLCITLMLAAAGIGSAEEAVGFDIPRIDSEADMEKALLYARCYHVRTPEEAVYLFLRACEEENAAYRMALMPEEEISKYEEFVMEWFRRQEHTTWVEQAREMGCPAYFAGAGSRMENYRIYNLRHDGSTGSATVSAVPYGKRGECFVEWELELKKENGWKVWLESESELISGEYIPEPLLEGVVRLGDFEVELSGYNEGVFDMLGMVRAVQAFDQGGGEETKEWPEAFSMEYRNKCVMITYLGEEPLEGRKIRVALTETENSAQNLYQGWAMKESAPDGMTEEEDGEGAYISSYGYSDSDGNGNIVFDGRKLMTGEPLQVYRAGTGFSQSGHCWQEGDRIRTYVWIYVDDELVEEGEVWTKEL